jgi:hypothetical protein
MIDMYKSKENIRIMDFDKFNEKGRYSMKECKNIVKNMLKKCIGCLFKKFDWRIVLDTSNNN